MTGTVFSCIIYLDKNHERSVFYKIFSKFKMNVLGFSSCVSSEKSVTKNTAFCSLRFFTLLSYLKLDN